MTDLESYFIWKMINILRNVTDFTVHFTTIGRYFMKDYGNLVISMIEILNKDVNLFN